MEFFKSFEEILRDFDVREITYLHYHSIINAIPTSWKQLLKSDGVKHIVINKCLIVINNKIYDLNKVNSKQVYFYKVKEKLGISKANDTFSRLYDLT